MITNYLNNLEGYLPETNKKEVREELESLILSQVEEQEDKLNRPLNRDEQAELLLKLGHPMRVASAYQSNQQLINKDYFPAYKEYLINILWIFAVLTSLAILPFSLAGGSIIKGLLNTFMEILENSVWIFFWVTAAFYWMQSEQTNLDWLYRWSPKRLIFTSRKVNLSRPQTLFEMLFEICFLLVWNQMYISEHSFIGTDFTNLISLSENWQDLYWLVNALVGTSLLLNLYKLIIAGYTKRTLVIDVVHTAAYLVLLGYILQFDQLFILSADQSKPFDWQKLEFYLDLNIRVLLAVVGLISVWDIVTSYKKLKISES